MFLDKIKEAKMKLYLIRHGQRGFFHEYDTLLPEGIWQSRQLGKFFKNRKIDVVYCSPQGRAKETLKYIRPFLRKNVQVHISKQVKQQNAPEELSKELVKKLKLVNETDEQTTKRGLRFIKLLEKEHPNKNILVVTHKMFIKHLVLALFNKKSKRESASIIEFGVIKGKPRNLKMAKQPFKVKNKTLCRGAFLKAEKKLKGNKKAIEKVKRKALEIAKKGGSREDIAQAYLDTPKLVILRGKNAAGKTTAFRTLMKRKEMKNWIFVDATAIKQKLGKGKGKVKMHVDIKRVLETGKNIMTEETSIKTVKKYIKDFKGYETKVFQFHINLKTAIKREALRRKIKGMPPRGAEWVKEMHKYHEERVDKDATHIKVDKLTKKQIVDFILKRLKD